MVLQKGISSFLLCTLTVSSIQSWPIKWAFMIHSAELEALKWPDQDLNHYYQDCDKPFLCQDAIHCIVGFFDPILWKQFWKYIIYKLISLKEWHVKLNLGLSYIHLSNIRHGHQHHTPWAPGDNRVVSECDQWCDSKRVNLQVKLWNWITG